MIIFVQSKLYRNQINIYSYIKVLLLYTKTELKSFT